MLKKIGVERRIYTAGRNKSVLDPFSPEKKEDVARLKKLQLDIHETFIGMVKERRGAKLVEDEEMFTGLFWTGTRAVELGLVDGLGDMRSHLKARFGDKTQLKLITPPRGLFGRSLSMFGVGGTNKPAEIAAAAAEGLADTLDDRAIWQRYGL